MDSETVLAPPGNLGRRLLPRVVDELAATDPDRIIYSFSRTKDPADGFRDVTIKQLSRAIDRCAWHIVKHLGGSVRDFPTIAYMGPQDVVYSILILASVKVGYKVLVTSLRNTVEAHLHLMEATDCQAFAMPPDFSLPAAKQILAARKMTLLHIPGPEYWLDDNFEGTDTPFPYEKAYDTARLEPLCVLHTSGSTGMPKPIIHTHGCASAIDAYSALPSIGLEPAYPKTCQGRRVYLGFPLFHAAGIANFISGPIFVGYTSVLGAYPPSPDVANGVHIHGNVQEACLPPTTLVDLSKDPEHLDNLSRLQRIMTGGGPLPKAAGALIAKKTKILNCLGTTETSQLPVQDCPEDWAYLKVSPCMGHQYRHVSGDLYEQVIVRNPHLAAYQGVFSTFPDLQEWPMKDLYSPHPTKKDLWLYKGRTDDIIVFSTGEKLNPLDMEDTISANPAVSACLISGQGRFQSALVIEAVNPPSNDKERTRLINLIWPSIKTANMSSPSHARIHRDMIVLVGSDKPFLRAGKGTVQRKLTLNLFEEELDALYSTSHSQTNGAPMSNGHGTNDIFHHGEQDKSVQDVVREIILDATDFNPDDVGSTQDLFGLGLDSLQVTVITRQINELLSSRDAKPDATIRTIYANPTIETLTDAVSSLLGEDSRGRTVDDHEKMEKLFQEATRELPVSGRQAQSSEGLTVLLTGGTGCLGSHVLDSLLSSGRVAHIYCLNRGQDSSQRQNRALEARDLQLLDPCKVTCLVGDVTQPHFGLQRVQYVKLIREVTDIIHSAWEVDFNLSLDSFHGHVSGIRRLVDFCSHSTYGAHIFFVSSIAAVSGMGGVVSEKVYKEWDVPLAMGYGQSKFVAERILDAAAAEAGVPITLCRIGQISGPTGAAGVWPQKEWLPSLVASSQHLGCLPDSLGLNDKLDWVPVDIVGQIVAEYVTKRTLATQLEGAEVLHISSPGTTTWGDLVDLVASRLGTGIEIVPLREWVDKLRESVTRGDDPATVPAVKLHEFYADLLDSEFKATRLDTRGEVVKKWKTILGLKVVQREWMENWLTQWGF